MAMPIQEQGALMQGCSCTSATGSCRIHRSVGGKVPFFEDRDWWQRFRVLPQSSGTLTPQPKGNLERSLGLDLGQCLSGRYRAPFPLPSCLSASSSHATPANAQPGRGRHSVLGLVWSMHHRLLEEHYKHEAGPTV